MDAPFSSAGSLPACGIHFIDVGQAIFCQLMISLSPRGLTGRKSHSERPSRSLRPSDVVDIDIGFLVETGEITFMRLRRETGVSGGATGQIAVVMPILIHDRQTFDAARLRWDSRYRAICVLNPRWCLSGNLQFVGQQRRPSGLLPEPRLCFAA